MSVDTRAVEPISCIQCGAVALPHLELTKSGQLGPACAKCGAPQGVVVSEPIAGAWGLTEKDKRVEPIPLAGGRSAPPRLAPSRPSPMIVPAAPPEPVITYSSPEEAIQARLSACRMEIAQLKIGQCRLKGLEAEAKSLERELGRVTAPSRH